ncbi:MAG TPA: response regulator [Candidatus Hypogeohydataceae bacterium YC38]
MKKRKGKGQGAVLVVEDDPGIHRLFQKALSPQGQVALQASSGEEALKFLQREEVAVVILDIFIPGIGGIKTLKEIKKRFPHLPVIILTGFGTLETAKESMLLGAYDYITKPFDLELVKSLICQAMKGVSLEEPTRRSLKKKVV